MDGPGSWSWETVEALLQTDRSIAVAVTGGGSRAVSWLFNHPGASRCFVEASIPYHEQSLADFLERPGPHPADLETARRLAERCGRRAAGLQNHAPVGVGVTAALATDRVRRGADRAFASVRTNDHYHNAALLFDKPGDRLLQEEVVSTILLTRLAAGCGVEVGGAPLPGWAHLETSQDPVHEGIEDLLAGRAEVVGMDAESAAIETVSADRVLVSGSFNPMHDGHRGLAAAAERLSGRTAAFELSVRNVDKPELAYRDILQRSCQDRDGRDLLLTTEPTFVGKARRLPGTWFAVGYDTALRLVEPSYYDGTKGMEAALKELLAAGCRFFVAGRHWQGQWCGLRQIRLPDGFADLFEEIPEAEFRLDISSSEIRSRGQ